MNKILLPTLFWFLVSAFTTLEAEDKVPFRSLELKAGNFGCMVTDFYENTTKDPYKKQRDEFINSCTVNI
jgi:hypothetical protein